MVGAPMTTTESTVRKLAPATIEDALRKLPPQSIEAEESVLGGVLLDNTAIDRALELLTPDDFSREAHRRIRQAMVALNQRSEPVDLVTLAEELKSRGMLQDV